MMLLIGAYLLININYMECNAFQLKQVEIKTWLKQNLGTFSVTLSYSIAISRYDIWIT